MFTRQFWKDTAERVISTAGQALLAYMLVGGAFDVMKFDWGAALGVTAGAAVISLVKCLIASKVGSSESASMVE